MRRASASVSQTRQWSAMPRRAAGGGELRVEEADVELRVVDHELGAVDERQELLRDLGERRLGREELVA